MVGDPYIWDKEYRCLDIRLSQYVESDNKYFERGFVNIYEVLKNFIPEERLVDHLPDDDLYDYIDLSWRECVVLELKLV